MEDHAMRGENFDDPVVRPPLLAQIAHGVGGLADEAEANGQVAAPGPSRVALETEERGIGKSLGKRGWRRRLEENRPGARREWVVVPPLPTAACMPAAPGCAAARTGEPRYRKHAAQPRIPVTVAHSQRLFSQAQSVKAIETRARGSRAG